MASLETAPLVQAAENSAQSTADLEAASLPGDGEDSTAPESTGGKKDKGKKDKKEKKPEKPKKNKFDDIKTHMANERTFFKWLFFGFHLGSMGTFVLSFFPPSAPHRISLVVGVWLVALSFMYYGLYKYFVRRSVMRNGIVDPDEWDDPMGPVMMATSLLILFVTIISYCFLTKTVPSKKAWSNNSIE